MRKYEFNWDLLGDLQDGRPNLGPQVDLDLYRLMQFTVRDILEERYGADEADSIFYAAGKKAGAEFYQHFIHPVGSVEEFVSKTQEVLREKKIGVMRVEEAMLEGEGRVMLTIDEDLDCSGLPELDYETCVYDEGFVSALFENFSMKKWSAKEVDCWTTGARTCRFLVTEE
jgi:predicted hydrocarbon binding protein